MDTLYARRMFAMFIIACLFLIGFLNEAGVFAFESNRIIFYAVAFLTTAILVHWVSEKPDIEAGSRRRVDKVLRTLNDTDLDLLRSRLAQEDQADPDDYGSMAELMQSGKRKNEVR